MFYLIINEDDYSKLEGHLSNYENQKINSPFFRDGYFLLSSNAPYNKLFEIIVSERIKTQFINPLISVKTFISLYKNVEFPEDVCIPEDYQYSIFENIIAFESGMKPSHNGSYILMNRFDEDENDGIKVVSDINTKLENTGLLLDESYYKRGMKEIFKYSIENADRELNLTESDKEILKKQQNYGLFVLATFLLDAYNYYSKDEIIKFMVNNFSLFKKQE